MKNIYNKLSLVAISGILIGLKLKYKKQLTFVDEIRSRYNNKVGKVINVGVGGKVEGFSTEVDGVWTGIDIDCIRLIVFAILFGDAKDVIELGTFESIDKYINYIQTTSVNRFEKLQSQEIDILIANTTITLARNNDYNLISPFINYFDSQGIAIRTDTFKIIASDCTLSELGFADNKINEITNHYNSKTKINEITEQEVLQLIIQGTDIHRFLEIYLETFQTHQTKFMMKKGTTSLNNLRKVIIKTKSYEQSMDYLIEFGLNENDTDNRYLVDELSKVENRIMDNITDQYDGDDYNLIIDNSDQHYILSSDKSQLKQYEHTNYGTINRSPYYTMKNSISSEPLGIYVRDSDLDLYLMIRELYQVINLIDTNDSASLSIEWNRGGVSDVAFKLSKDSVNYVLIENLIQYLSLIKLDPKDDDKSGYYRCLCAYDFLTDEQKLYHKFTGSPQGRKMNI